MQQQVLVPSVTREEFGLDEVGEVGGGEADGEEVGGEVGGWVLEEEFVAPQEDERVGEDLEEGLDGRGVER